jgi:hypothetical protein
MASPARARVASGGTCPSRVDNSAPNSTKASSMVISAMTWPNSTKQSHSVWLTTVTATPAAKAARNPSPPTASPATKAPRTSPIPYSDWYSRRIWKRWSTRPITQDPAAPTAKPAAGPSTNSWPRKPSHPAGPPRSARATAISTSRMGRTTMSLVPASTRNARRTDRGMRRSRRTSRSTTGSVEARIVPSRRARMTGSPSSSIPSPASSPMTSSVAGPRTRTGTSQSRRSSVSSRLTASRNSTRARATTATTSRTLLSRPIEMNPRPRSPSRKPRPRNSIGNDRGARSTRPAARADTTRTPAIKPKAVSSSNQGS